MIRAHEFQKKMKQTKCGKPQKEDEEKEEQSTTPAINCIKIDAISGLTIPAKSNKMEVEVEDLEIQLPYEVWVKLMTYTKLIDEEINGLGIVEREGSKFIIKDLVLLEQKVSSAQCDIKPDAMVSLMQEMIEAGRGEDIPKLRLWWHSHNSMGAFWSSTDDSTGKNFAGSEFLVSIVTNHKGEMRGKVNLYSPIDLTIDNVGITVLKPMPDPEIIEKCKEDIRQHVKKEYFSNVVYPRHMGFYGNMYHQENQEEESSIIVPKKNGILEKSLKVGPYGPCIVQNGVRAMWREDMQKYVFEDINTQTPMSEEDAEAIMGFNVNDTAFFGYD